MTKRLNFPTILTILRMILVVPFMVFLILGANANSCGSACPAGVETLLACPDVCVNEQIPFYVIALIMFVLAAITDKIDGWWARKYKQVTELGKFLDPLADKMLVNSAFLALVVMEIVPMWLFALILWRDFAVDGMRMMMARNGETVAASIWGKLKTTIQMVALVALLLNLVVQSGVLGAVGAILLYLALALTLYSGADYLIKGWSKALK